MKKAFLGWLMMMVLSTRAFSVAAGSAWPNIKVDVLASQPVTTAHSLKEQADGFQRLAITISNQGQQPLTIEKITVHIPLPDHLTDDVEMVYGGSCMGRTHLLRHNVATQTKQSSSHMYEMVRLANGTYLFAGSLSWRIFMPNFRLRDGTFEVWSNGEGKQIKPGETIHYEQIVLRRAENWVDLLNQFGNAIAAENGISKLKKVDFKGWATWDYYAYGFSAEDIHGNLEKLKTLHPDANLVQIDAGWYATRGDYTSVRPDLIGGMKGIADRIKSAGMIPGIWIDGFRANSTSEVCKKHPEYFLHDQDGNMIIEVRRPEGADRDRVYFDYSHPGARAHIAECIRAIRQDWGFPYFKVDRMSINEARMWADFNKLNGNCRLSGDNLVTLRPERQSLVKEVFNYPPMDETIPLDLWRHGTHKGDGFELILARKGRDIHLGVFNWSDESKEYELAAFGMTGPVKLEGRHSTIFKYAGTNSFAQLCQKLQTR